MLIRKISAFFALLFLNLLASVEANRELILNKKSDIIEQSDDSKTFYTVAINDL